MTFYFLLTGFPRFRRSNQERPYSPSGSSHNVPCVCDGHPRMRRSAGRSGGADGHGSGHYHRGGVVIWQRFEKGMIQTSGTMSIKIFSA